MSKQEYILTQVIDVTKTQMNSPKRSFFLTKALLIVLLYTFLIINSLYNMVSPGYVPECIHDEVHVWTSPITLYLAANPMYRNILIVTASLMIDVCTLVLALRFVLYDKNYKVGLIGISFYLFRGFLQSVFYMKFPSDYIWGHPGVFSITVPYEPANDFFYSGHVGICMICLITFKRTGLKNLTRFALITLVVEFFTLLVTRAHYFIDLVTGIIVAHYFYLAGDWVEEYFQNRNKQVLLKQEVVIEKTVMDPRKLEQNSPRSNGKKKKVPSPKSKNRSMTML